MTKKEKILAISLVISMFMLITSSICTLIKNKPENSKFAIEILIEKCQSKMFFKNDMR